MFEEAAESLSAPKLPRRGPRSGIERLVPAPLVRSLPIGGRMMLTVNLPDEGRVAGQDPNLGGCSRSTRHHVPFGERSGAERAVMSGS